MAVTTLISAPCQLIIVFDFVRKRSDRFGPPTGKSVRFSSMISESSLEEEVGLTWCAFLPHFSYSITFLLFLNFFSPFITFLLVLIQFEGSSVPMILFSRFHVFLSCSLPLFFVLVFLCTARFVFVWYSHYHFITTVLPVSVTSPTNVILFRCWTQFWLCDHGAVTDILNYDCNYR